MSITAASGASIAYEVAGDGEPVLFVQGAGVPGSGWRPQVEGLSGRFSCASFDNRGVGASGPPARGLSIDDFRADALAVMDGLGWDSAHVVGHSVGGLVAQSLALEARSRVRSLTLMCTFHHGAQASRLAPRSAWIGLRTYVGSRGMRRRAFLEFLLSPDQRRARGRSGLDALAAELAPLFGRDLGDPAAIAMKQLAAAAAFDARARLGSLAGLPTLILSATHDPIALPAFGRDLASAITGARYEERDAAHGLPITHAAEVNELLAAHLTRVSG